MSEERDERQRVITTWENICHVLDAAIRAVAEHRGFEMEPEDWRIAGHAAGENILLQMNIQEFADSVEADLEALPTQDSVTQEGMPNHQSEFGL